VPKRVFRTTLRPVLPGGKPASPLELHGTVKSRATFHLAGIHFGESNVVGQPPHPRKAVVTVHVPCDEITAVADDGSLFSSLQVTRLDENRFQLTLTPDTTRKPGPFRTTVRVYDKRDTERRTVLTGIGVDGQLCDR